SFSILITDQVAHATATQGCGITVFGGPNLRVTESVSGSATTTKPGILTQTLVLSNSGSATSFGASIQGAAGFSISPNNGFIGSGPNATTNLQVSFDTTKKPPGIYTAT